jgi:hypothetical protein
MVNGHAKRKQRGDFDNMARRMREYRRECLKCGRVYVGVELWEFCPRCGGNIGSVEVELGVIHKTCVKPLAEWPYSVAEVAKLLNLSRATITRMFEHEPGVIVIKRPERMNKRSFRTMRIPRAVLERVVRRITL